MSTSESESDEENNIFQGPVTPYQFEPAAKPKVAGQERVSAATFVGRSQQDCKSR